MRFISHINELRHKVGDLRDIADTLRRDCKPYLLFMKNNNYKKLLRRFNSNRTTEFELIVPRTDRKPRDTPIWVQELMDAQFKKKFGVKARSSGVFCKLIEISDYTFSGTYYSAFAIFPVGAYDCIWSPDITDLYLEWTYKMEEVDKDERKAVTKQWVEEVVNKYTDEDISNSNSEEIMLICDKYYAVQFNMMKSLLRILSNEVQ